MFPRPTPTARLSHTIMRSHLAPLLAILAAWFLAPGPSALAAPAQQGPAAATVAAKPFLWRIEKGPMKGYLYGTIHLPDARALNLPGEVEEAFKASGSFFAEIETTPKAEQEVQRAALLPAASRLDQLVGAETWARIEARLAGAGLPPMYSAGMARMRPWALGATLPMLKYLPEMSAGKPPLDKMLFQRAAKDGKTTGGLETPAEQIAAFEVFTQAEHIRILKDSLDELDRYEGEGRDLMEETLSAWLSGDEPRLLALMDAGFGSDPELRERAAAALLWRRNLRIASRIEDRMQADTETFFAVGALHMPDAPAQDAIAPGGRSPSKEDAVAPQPSSSTFEVTPGESAPKLGLVTLLRQRGYTVNRIR